MSIENMIKGQFSNQNYRQYRRCMITGSIIHRVNSRMRSIQSGKASDANRLVGRCMGTGKSFGGNAATSYGLANENKAYVVCWFTRTTASLVGAWTESVHVSAIHPD